MHRNIIWGAEEKLNLEILITKCKEMNEKECKVLQEQKPVCCLSPLRHNCSTMLGQCLVPARENNALKSLMAALNKEPSIALELCNLDSTWATQPDPLGKLRVNIFIILWNFWFLIVQNILPSSYFFCLFLKKFTVYHSCTRGIQRINK